MDPRSLKNAHISGKIRYCDAETEEKTIRRMLSKGLWKLVIVPDVVFFLYALNLQARY